MNRRARLVAALSQVGGIERFGQFEVEGGTILNQRRTAFDKTHPSLADARIHQAMSHTVGRQSIVCALPAGRTIVPA